MRIETRRAETLKLCGMAFPVAPKRVWLALNKRELATLGSAMAIVSQARADLRDYYGGDVDWSAEDQELGGLEVRLGQLIEDETVCLWPDIREAAAEEVRDA